MFFDVSTVEVFIIQNFCDGDPRRQRFVAIETEDCVGEEWRRVFPVMRGRRFLLSRMDILCVYLIVYVSTYGSKDRETVLCANDPCVGVE
jgi:hypothetical protein